MARDVHFCLLASESDVERAQNHCRLFYNDCRPADLATAHGRHAAAMSRDGRMLAVLRHGGTPFTTTPVLITALVLHGPAGVRHLVRFLADFTQRSGDRMRGIRVNEATVLHLEDGVTPADVARALQQTLNFRPDARGSPGT